MEVFETNFYSLSVKEVRTYVLVSLFVAGNVLLPFLCHAIPNGGHIFLPIFFFTLVAAYKYGIVAGLMTALASPLVNHLLFGMPVAGMLPFVLLKSVLLAVIASYAAHRYAKVSVLILSVVVLSYQVVGSLVQYLFIGDFVTQLRMFAMGLVGMAIEVVLGYFVINKLG